MDATRVVLLVNATARGAHRLDLQSVTSVLAGRFTVETRHPRSAEETTSDARTLGEADDTIVIAVGGDGTASAVANGLPRGGTMGIIPLGTGNDLARQLGVPREPIAAASRIIAGVPHPMDVVDVNGRRFCTVAGMGLVTRSTIFGARLKSARPVARRLVPLSGGMIYRLAATAALMEQRDEAHGWLRWLDADTGVERERELTRLDLFVTNNTSCGGGLRIPSGASSADGVFEVAVVAPRGRARLLAAFARLSAGLPLGPDVLEVIRATRAVITTSSHQALVADGDVVAEGREFVLRTCEAAVQVVY